MHTPLFLRPQFYLNACSGAVLAGAVYLSSPYVVVTAVYVVACAFFFGAECLHPMPKLQQNVRVSSSSGQQSLMQQRAASVVSSLCNTVLGDITIFFLVRQPQLLYSLSSVETRSSGQHTLALVYMYTSPFFFLFFCDTWFYWSHRFLHKNTWAYKTVHALHHQRRNPECFDLFFMHPLECFFTVVLPLVVIPRLFPVHWFIYDGFLAFTILIDVYGHIGYDSAPFHPVKISIYSYLPLPWRKIFLSAAHHDRHHSHFQGNYALYFQFWDPICGTEMPWKSTSSSSPIPKAKSKPM